MSATTDAILAKYGAKRSGTGTNSVTASAATNTDAILAKYGVSRSGAATTPAAAKGSTAPNLFEILSKTVTGGAKSSAAGFTGALGTTQAVTGGVARSNYLQRDIEQWQTELERYRYQAKNAADEADKLYYLMEAGKTQNNIERAQQELSKTATAGQNTMEMAVRLAEDADKDIARAKEGTGKVGSFLVDLGAAGTQMAGDALTGGLGAMAVRSFGSGALEAQQSGASLGQQVGYGLGSAAVGTLTEKIANVAGPFKKVFGSGLLDKALSKVAAKPAGKLAISALSEGFEEGAEALAQPLLQKLTYNPEAAYDADWLADTLYSMAIGGAMGGVGGAVDVAWNGRGAQNAVRNGAGAETAQNEGKFTPAEQAGAQGAVGDIMTQEAQRLFGQNKTAPNMGAEQITTQENIARYRSDIDEVFSGKYPSGKVVRMGDTPSILLNYGAHQRPLTMTQDAAFKVAYPAGYMGGKHNLGMSVVKQLPYQLADPVAILKSTSQDNSLVILTEWKDGDTDVIVPIHLDKQGAIELENRAASAYGKGDIDRILGENNANVLYTKNNEDIRQLLSKGVQFPQAMADDILAKNSMPQAGANVNVDPLLQMIMGGNRVDQSKASNEQFAVLAERGDVGVDAAGKMFQINPAQHIDNRTMESVGSRAVNAFQFDHPQLHGYFQRAANALIADADLSMQFGLTRSYARGMQGNKVNQKAQTSAHLRRAMDETGLSRSAIIDAAQRIVNDKGQENVKAAKQVEIILDDMLTNGWQPMVGDAAAPNEAYIKAKGEIAGSQATESGHGLDGIGAADAGSLNSAYDDLQAQSDTFHPEGAYAARPVDVPTTDFEGRNIPKASSTVMGAQGTPDAAVQQMEQQIASGSLSFDTITDSESVAKAQTTMREKGFDGALEQYRQAVAANVATKDNTCLGQQLLLQAMRDGNTAYTAELLSLYTRNSTTAAQAMQAQSIFRKLSPEGQLVAVQKAVDALNEKYGTEVKLDEQDVADFMDAGSDEARQEVTKRIVRKAAKAVPGTFKAKFDTIRYLAMLGNPRTHIRNILGNTLFQVPVAVKNRVGAVAEGVAYAASGGRTERTKALFGVNPLGKLAKEASADWVNAKDFLTQSSKYSDAQTSLWDIEQEAHAFSDENVVGRGVNALSDFNSNALEAEDTAAKKFIYTQSLAGYLKANGCRSMADADAALLNKARTYAANEALRNTFNDTNAVSSAVSRLGAAHKSDNPVARAAGYAIEGVLPFKKTPANILVRAGEYSPVGAAVGIFNTVRGAKSGDMQAVSQGLDRIAAGLTGTGIMALGALAAGNGWVTGGEDEDEKQADFNDLTGHQPYALEMKDGTSVTLDWLAPEAIPFFMGVELYKAAESGGLSIGELGDTLKNATAPMLEMSMLQGLNDTVDNAAYAAFSGGSVLGSLVTSALTNYVTQVFPTLGGQIERSGEDVRMSTYTDKNSELSTDMQYTMGKASQKIPGWDYQQVPYIDAWGREEATGSAAWRAFSNLVNPAYVSQVEVDAVESELQRLADATGESGIFPERAAKYITTADGRKDFTAEEYVQYAKELGKTSYELVSSGMETKAYAAMADSEKVEYLNDLYSYAGAAARANAGGKALEGWQANAKNAKRDLGVSTAEYIALYQKYGSSILSGNGYEKTKEAVKSGLTVEQYAHMKENEDANGNGSVSQAEAQSYLDRQDYSRSQKADLWPIINSSWKKNPYA